MEIAFNNIMLDAVWIQPTIQVKSSASDQRRENLWMFDEPWKRSTWSTNPIKAAESSQRKSLSLKFRLGIKAHTFIHLVDKTVVFTVPFVWRNESMWQGTPFGSLPILSLAATWSFGVLNGEVFQVLELQAKSKQQIVYRDENYKG